MNYTLSRKQNWLSVLTLLTASLLIASDAVGQDLALNSIEIESNRPESLRLASQPESLQPAALGSNVAQGASEFELGFRLGQVVNTLETRGRQRPVHICAEDDVWLISARESHCAPADPSLLQCSRMNNGNWDAAELDELVSLHSTDQTKVTMFYVHGNRTALKWAQARGLQFYENALHSEKRPPLRFVIFAWRSDVEQLRFFRDFKIKSDRSVTIGETFGKLLCRFDDRNMVVAGFSLGAQVVLEGLSNPDLQLQDDHWGQYRVAIFAPALNPAFIQSDLSAISQNPSIHQIEVFLNRRDCAVKVSRLLARRQTHSTFSLRDLANVDQMGSNPVTVCDISREVRKWHAIVNYADSRTVAIKLAMLLNATFQGSTTLPAMSIESAIGKPEFVDPKSVDPARQSVVSPAN